MHGILIYVLFSLVAYWVVYDYLKSEGKHELKVILIALLIVFLFWPLLILRKFMRVLLID